MAEVATVEKFECLRDYILAKRIEEDKTAGGIVLSTGEIKGNPWRCKILKVGPGDYLHGEFHKNQLSVGDEVYVGPFAGYELRLGAEKFILCRENMDVLGKLAP